jgi:hypothetical protein
MPAGRLNRPGLYRDYIEVWDFTFDVHFDSGTEDSFVTYSINVVPGRRWEGTA